MRLFEFRLADGEDSWYLKTDVYTLDSLKKYIQNNKWIKLNSPGQVSIPNGWKYIPKEADVQTCTIVSVVEDEYYQKNIDEWNKSVNERMIIIEKIDRYKFNFKMRLWAWWKSLNEKGYEGDKHPYLQFNKRFLNEILDKCKKYKCELKGEK